MKLHCALSGHRSSAMIAMAVCFACLLASAPIRAKTFTIEQVMNSPFPDELTRAAHGERVAWMFDIRGARNVWIADGPDFVAHQITHYSGDDGMPINSLRLTPDGRTAVYARGSETNHQGEVADPTSDVQQPEQQVWAVDADGGNPRLLGTMNCSSEDCEDIEISPDGKFTVWAARNELWIAPVSGAQPARRLAYVRGNNLEPRWSPDGKEIAFESSRGDHGFIALYDFGRDRIRYLAPTVSRDMMPRWSPDGTEIAFVRIPGIERGLPIIPVRPQPWSIWVGNPSTGQAHEVWRSTDDLNGSLVRYWEDGTFYFAGDHRIVFTSQEDGWNHLYSVPDQGGPPPQGSGPQGGPPPQGSGPQGGQALLLTPGNFSVKDVSLSPDRKTVLYSSNENDVDRRHIWKVGVDGGEPVPLTRGETIEWTPVETGDSQFVLCLGSSATTPAMPYRITSGGREVIARSALPADFPSAALVAPRQVIFKSLDGLEIHGQLFVPRGRSGPGPALVYMHGGPIRQMMLGFHPMDYYHYAYAENQYLVSLGFVVLSVNYRLGIMYGRAFRTPPHSVWRGASEYQDIVAGGKYLQSLPIVDPHKVGLWGGSYGGFLTAMGLARNSDIFAAGVDFHGVHNWAAFLPNWTRTQHVPDLAQAMKLAFQSSPDAYVSTWKSPVLLIQGDDDRNVPFSQMVDLVQRLRQQHVPFEQIVIPDEIHGFLRWGDWVRTYQATADFFIRVLVKGEKIGAE
jgi:dipeptidyl aminopeptidase/acylaminoacyl peptidase